MDSPGLISFPLPMLTALLCAAIAGLVWRLDLGARRASRLLSLVFALGALQAFLVGLRFGYGSTAFVPVQRILPIFLGPTIYLGFLALTVEARPFRAVLAAHFLAPLVVLAGFWVVVDDLRLLDWVISASYLFYIVALVMLWCKGPDILTKARVDLAGPVSNWILRGVGLLVFLLILDSVIAYDFAVNAGANVSRLISLGTIPIVLGLLLILSSLPRFVPRPAARSDAAAPSAYDVEIEAKLAALMAEEQMFLDPELTVQRLAKRLHLPTRDVSGAINRTRNMNMSQYVNEFRLARAAELLVSGKQSIKSVAEASGFLTRSNFYREFHRVYGMSPTDYRRSI